MKIIRNVTISYKFEKRKFFARNFRIHTKYSTMLVLFKLTVTNFTALHHLITTRTKNDYYCPRYTRFKRIKKETSSEKKIKASFIFMWWCMWYGSSSYRASAVWLTSFPEDSDILSNENIKKVRDIVKLGRSRTTERAALAECQKVNTILLHFEGRKEKKKNKFYKQSRNRKAHISFYWIR